MKRQPIFQLRCFATATHHPFTPEQRSRHGKVYADVPHRYFSSIEALKDYAVFLKNLGVDVLLLLPHFQPSFSEYVVSDYQRPCPLFSDWEIFSNFMKFVENLGMDRMIDIPFNHADWQAQHLQREWYIDHQLGGLEAGADDIDADGNRVRINWGAFILDNGHPDLQRYWLEQVIFPHFEHRHVNSIRIDAAWGLDEQGLKTIVGETRKRFPHAWFVAENLGMDKLINLARSGIEAGADRFFNNLYWYTGGRSIPTDVYRFYRGSGGLPSCTIASSHDVLTPAMKSLALLRGQELGRLNDKALVRQVVEREHIHSLHDVNADCRRRILRLMELDFALAAFMTTDLMFVAGAEKGLLQKVDVLGSGPQDLELGIDSNVPDVMREMIHLRQAEPLLASEGVIIPFGNWSRSEPMACRGFVRRTNSDYLLVAANMNLDQPQPCPIPRRFRQAKEILEVTAAGYAVGTAAQLPATVELPPGEGLILIAKGAKSCR